MDKNLENIFFYRKSGGDFFVEDQQNFIEALEKNSFVSVKGLILEPNQSIFFYRISGFILCGESIRFTGISDEVFFPLKIWGRM